MFYSNFWPEPFTSPPSLACVPVPVLVHASSFVEELLRPLVEEGNDYTNICFSNKSFGLDAARVAERILMEVQSNLTDVDLLDFIAGRGEDKALQVMAIFSSVLQGCVLRTLNLSDNALGEKGVRAFGFLLKSQKTLEELYFMNNGISVEDARAICELLPSVERLRVLHFHNNITGDEGAENRSSSLSTVSASSGANGVLPPLPPGTQKILAYIEAFFVTC